VLSASVNLSEATDFLCAHSINTCGYTELNTARGWQNWIQMEDRLYFKSAVGKTAVDKGSLYRKGKEDKNKEQRHVKKKVREKKERKQAKNKER
jgi:hypothetical protein